MIKHTTNVNSCVSSHRENIIYNIKYFKNFDSVSLTVHKMAGENNSGGSKSWRESSHCITCNWNNDGATGSQQF